MKNFLLTLMTVLAVMVAGTVTASAHDFVQGRIYYNFLEDDETSVEVTFCDEDGDEFVDEGKEYTGTVVIPESVTYSGKSYSVKSIGYLAFAYCYELGQVKFPSTLESIKANAFVFSNMLSSIEIPASVLLIEAWAFDSCQGVKSIVVEEGNKVYDSRGGCNAIIETATNTLILGCKNTVIPVTVMILEDGAFSCMLNDWDGFTELSIPEGVTEIGSGVFANCACLSKISMPSTLTKIGTDVFWACYELKEIICCSATPPVIEKGIAWDDEGNEYEIINAFEMVPEDARLIVPVGAAEAYAKAEGWERFAGNIVEDDTLTGVESVIAGENAPVEYYNLQGVKETRPENGIFIRKQGSKTTKVVL